LILTLLTFSSIWTLKHYAYKVALSCRSYKVAILNKFYKTLTSHKSLI
jgi:hypothetical protein